MHCHPSLRSPLCNRWRTDPALHWHWHLRKIHSSSSYIALMHKHHGHQSWCLCHRSKCATEHGWILIVSCSAPLWKLHLWCFSCFRSFGSKRRKVSVLRTRAMWTVCKQTKRFQTVSWYDEWLMIRRQKHFWYVNMPSSHSHNRKQSFVLKWTRETHRPHVESLQVSVQIFKNEGCFLTVVCYLILVMICHE